jgi:hypothetical protein
MTPKFSQFSVKQTSEFVSNKNKQKKKSNYQSISSIQNPNKKETIVRNRDEAEGFGMARRKRECKKIKE